MTNVINITVAVTGVAEEGVLKAAAKDYQGAWHPVMLHFMGNSAERTQEYQNATSSEPILVTVTGELRPRTIQKDSRGVPKMVNGKAYAPLEITVRSIINGGAMGFSHVAFSGIITFVGDTRTVGSNNTAVRDMGVGGSCYNPNAEYNKDNVSTKITMWGSRWNNWNFEKFDKDADYRSTAVVVGEYSFSDAYQKNDGSWDSNHEITANEVETIRALKVSNGSGRSSNRYADNETLGGSNGNGNSYSQEAPAPNQFDDIPF